MTRRFGIFFALAVAFGAHARCYEIGAGIADVTGPAAEVTFMGYANMEQKGRGIHLRQFSRAFIIDDGSNKIVFVSVDSGMIGNGLRKMVLKKLEQKFGNEYNLNNVMISGTHTHSGPGGFLMDLLFDLTSLGFVSETFYALVNGIVLSISRAHENRVSDGKIFLSKGKLENANINRSPTAYLANPPEERERYEYDVDKTMLQLGFKDGSGKGLGAISWFAIHPVSMNYTNKLISSDNVGYASVLFEKSVNLPGRLIGKGPFVAAFASTNLGDVSPNIMGPKCEFSGNPCNIYTSKCSEKELCFASGPGKDMFESTEIIAKRLFDKASELWTSESGVEITGPVHVVHQYVNMPQETVQVPDPMNPGKFMTAKGCLPAMGHSFAAGTTDGPGLFSFKQGETMPDNPLWNQITNMLQEPSPNQTICHGIKPILLSTGEVKYPYEWQPNVVSTQLATIGPLALACVPGEFTTMSGRRLRSQLKTSLSLDSEEDVIVAGLCNTYSDYVTTPEEYQIQRYEGASTIYGPYTLPIYLKQYGKLAKLIEMRDVDPGPEPAEFFNRLITVLPPVIFDSAPWGAKFGQCVREPPLKAKIGEIVSAVFVAGHPRNDLKNEETFLTVEKLWSGGNWTVVATDADWETRFIWRRTSFLLGTSEGVVKWDTRAATPGSYRFGHFGSYKYIFGRINPYQGYSRVFTILP